MEGLVMSKTNMWSFKLSTASIVLIPAAVGINYIGKLFAGLLKLPLWLDSIGTILAAMLAGPIVGALCGLINNIIYGLTLDPVSFVYALTSVGIGIAAGIMAYKGYIRNIGMAVVMGLVISLVATVISTPINIVYWGGQTGNIWGDALFATLIANDFPLWLASALDELVVDIPDKIAVVVISFLLYKGLPNSLDQLFKNEKNRVEQL